MPRSGSHMQTKANSINKDIINTIISFLQRVKSAKEALGQFELAILRVVTPKIYRESQIFLVGYFNPGGVDWDSGRVPTGAGCTAHCEKP